MQAAQIDPDKLYAVRIAVPKTASTLAYSYVARFKVHTVESHMSRRKLKPTSADYRHHIHGFIDERDVPPELLPAEEEARKAYLKRDVDPSEIESEYEKFMELKERAAAEDAATKAQKAARLKNAQQLVDLFYRFTGLKPIPKTNWSDPSPFKADDYHHSVSINQEGCIALFKVLTPHQPAK